MDTGRMKQYTERTARALKHVSQAGKVESSSATKKHAREENVRAVQRCL